MKAPHKPLFLALLLGVLEASPTHPNRFLFAELKQRFDDLWGKFGWNSHTSLNYPFRHLHSDGLWEVHDSTGRIEVPGRMGHGEKLLTAKGTYGCFPDSLWSLVRENSVRRAAFDLICAEYFPPGLRQELRVELGAGWEPAPPAGNATVELTRRGRDPARQAKFRSDVLRAYELRCAVCGFGPRCNRAPSAIDAAHIWPFEFGGPFEVQNGLALCRLHHWALDSGTIGFTDDSVVLVSGLVTDGETLDRFVREFSGKKLRSPLHERSAPAREFLERHREKIFQQEAI